MKDDVGRSARDERNSDTGLPSMRTRAGGGSAGGRYGRQMPIQSGVRDYLVELRKRIPVDPARRFFAVIQVADDEDAKTEARRLESRLNGVFEVSGIGRAEEFHRT